LDNNGNYHLQVNPVRIALIHDWLTGMRGGERCLEALCELYPDADLYTLIYLRNQVSPTIRAMKVRPSWISRLHAVESYYRYLLPLFPNAIESFDLKEYDLVISSSHCVAKGVLPGRALHIAYIHAPMRYVWDQYDAYFGADASWLARTGMSLFRRRLQQWDVRSSKRVDFFVANSRNVAAKIKNLYGREASVVYPPVEIDRFFIREKQEPYYLIVSALVPYKRIDVAIAAFNGLKLPLKIVGDGPLRKKLERMAEPNIDFLGWVDDGALPALYASCQALVFPGEEDFGIVPLEAQASGRPVIAYGKGGALETVMPLDGRRQPFPSVGKPTGIFFESSTADHVMAAVRLFEASKDAFEPAALRARACGFSRARYQAQMKAFIDGCLERRAGER
jgi:glycosyltransferase involved in cell wall biosynthesis